MSMRDWAVDDYGFVFDEEIIKMIASKVLDDFSEDDDVDDLGYSLYDKGMCEYIGEFTGEAQKLEDNGLFTWRSVSVSYDCDSIYYVPTHNYPTLFRRAYNSMDDIVAEFKGRLGMYLPKDFDYRSRICHITGTYYG